MNPGRRDRSTASARRWIAIELVLVAKMAAAGADAIDGSPDLVLDRDVLEDGFDHEVGVAGVGEIGRGPDAHEGRVALVGGQAALVDGALEVPGDPLAAGLGAGELGFVEDHVLADRGVDLGDAVAHHPGAGHEDVLDRAHGPSVGGGRSGPARDGPGPPRHPGRAAPAVSHDV